MPRNIFFPVALLAAVGLATTADEGFVSLFDGKSLEGWSSVGGKPDNWSVQDGVLVTKGQGGGWLSTNKMYSDFVLKLEYRLGPRGNSGVFLRAPHQGDPAYTGMEIQILDDDADAYKDLKPFQYTGSVYGVIAAKRGHTKPPGQWNAMEITTKGPRVTVKLNGETIVDGSVEDHSEAFAEHPGLKRKDGYIGLQSHSEPLEFRDIQIKELK